MIYSSINIADLETHMNQRAVKFFFVKSNGDLREATGTRNLSLIPNVGQPTGHRAPDSVVNFWDLEKGKWRCLSRSTQAFLIR